MNNNEELKELVEEMQEFLHKGNKLVQKAQKKMGMPMSGMGQRNFPHDLPPAFPQYPARRCAGCYRPAQHRPRRKCWFRCQRPKSRLPRSSFLH